MKKPDKPKPIVRGKFQKDKWYLVSFERIHNLIFAIHILDFFKSSKSDDIAFIEIVRNKRRLTQYRRCEDMIKHYTFRGNMLPPDVTYIPEKEKY